MKKIILLSLLLAMTYLNAQNGKKKSLFSHTIITLTDGGQLEGLGRIIGDDTIIFKENDEAKEEIYSPKNLGELYIQVGMQHKRYVYMNVEGSKGKDSIKLMEKVLSGKINLYQVHVNGTTYASSITGGYGFTNYSHTTYYISREGKDYVSYVSTGNTRSPRFKSIANRYFYDCPELLEKIRSKDFYRHDVRGVVTHYNENCE